MSRSANTSNEIFMQPVYDCVCAGVCVFLQSVAVLCKYKAAAVDSRQPIEGEGKRKGNRVENRLTKRAEEKGRKAGDWQPDKQTICQSGYVQRAYNFGAHLSRRLSMCACVWHVARRRMRHEFEPSATGAGTGLGVATATRATICHEFEVWQMWQRGRE